MKITCEYNEITYIFNTTKGHLLSDRYKLLLSKLEKEKMENGEMDYFTLEVSASCDDLELFFEFQGLALSLGPDDQLQEVQEYIEDHLIFSKIEEKFKQAHNKSKLPIWANEKIKDKK